MLSAGKLRHRLTLQKPANVQDQRTGDMTPTWADVRKVWAEVVPISGREFVAAASEQSKVSARITVRAAPDYSEDMRLVSAATGKIYYIEAVLPDPVSGDEYFSLVVGEGVKR